MLRDRLMAALPLGALTLAAFLIPGWTGRVLFLLLGLGMAGCGSHEFFQLSAKAGVRGYTKFTTAFGCAYLLAAALGSHTVRTDGAMIAIFALFIFGSFLRALSTGKLTGDTLLSVWVSIAGFVYLFWCLSFLLRLFSLGPEPSGRFLLLFITVVTKAGDTGAYTAGTLTARRPGGNRKLVPAISPKKSWEGLAGGIAASVLAAFLMMWLLSERMTVGGVAVITPWSALAVGLLAPLAGLAGDLAESALKRAANAKDSGQIPGLGGALDILDSLLPVVPLFYAYVMLIIAP